MAEAEQAWVGYRWVIPTGGWETLLQREMSLVTCSPLIAALRVTQNPEREALSCVTLRFHHRHVANTSPSRSRAS